MDALLRTLEPPSHDQWREDRGDDPIVSKKVLNKLYAWVNDKVRDLVNNDDQTEVDAEGISQYLPDDLEDAPKGKSEESEIVDDEPAPVLVMRIRSAPRITTPTFEMDSNANTDDEGEDEGPDKGEPEPSDVITDGPPNNRPGGMPGKEVKDNKALDKTDPGYKRIDLTKVRIYCSDPSKGRYRMLFEPQSADASYLRVFVIGEVGSEPAPIASYSVNDGPEKSEIPEKGLIGPLALPQGERAALDVVLENSLRCALGVTAYAN